MNKYSIVSVYKDPHGGIAVIVAYNMLTEKTELFDIIDWEKIKNDLLTQEEYDLIISRLVEWRKNEREKSRKQWIYERY